MIDPRIKIIDKRLRDIKYIYALSSSKGGVGKTFLSVILSIASTKIGLKTGLLDLDFTNPGCHLLLNKDIIYNFPEEDKGVLPYSVKDINFMSIAFYIRDKPIALRGEDIDNLIKEIFAITIWRNINILYIDMPPGLSDEFLDILNLSGKIRLIIISTPDLLSIRSVERMLSYLISYKKRIAGIIGNMVYNNEVRKLALNFGIKYLGSIPYINHLNNIIINEGIEKILHKSVYWSIISDIIGNLI